MFCTYHPEPFFDSFLVHQVFFAFANDDLRHVREYNHCCAISMDDYHSRFPH